MQPDGADPFVWTRADALAGSRVHRRVPIHSPVGFVGVGVLLGVLLGVLDGVLDGVVVGVIVGVLVIVGVIVLVGVTVGVLVGVFDGVAPGDVLGVIVGVGEQKSISSIFFALDLSTSSTDLILKHKTSLTLLTVGILNKLY